MTILAIFKANGITKEMYEALRKEVDWEHQQPDGIVLHAAAFDKSGSNFCVADIWESEEHLNNYVSSKLLPVMKKINMPMPEGEIFQIHNVNANPVIDKYKV
jgi:hypothetical protein